MTKSHLVTVYRAAAERAEVEPGFSCGAIERATNNHHLSWSDETKLYQKIMLPRTTFPLRNIGDWNERKNIRVLLLLMMCEWVKTDWKGSA